MNRDTFIKICNAIERKDITLGNFDLSVTKLMCHLPERHPTQKCCFKFNDLTFYFLQYWYYTCKEPTYQYYLSIVSNDGIEVDYYNATFEDEIKACEKVFKKKDKQLDELLKDFLES